MKANHLISKAQQIDEVDRLLESDNGVDTESNQFQSINIATNHQHASQNLNIHSTTSIFNTQVEVEQLHQNNFENQLKKTEAISEEESNIILGGEPNITEQSQRQRISTLNDSIETKDQNQSLYEYFQNLGSNLKNFSKIKAGYMKPLHKKMQDEINSNSQLIQPSSVQLKLINKNERKRIQQQQIMKSLQEKRLDTIRMLRQIESEEVSLFHKKRKYNSVKPAKKEKSLPNQQQNSKIKDILKAKKQYELELEMKKQHILMMKQEKMLEEMKRKDEQKLKIQIEKRQEIKKHLKQLETKAIQRQQALKRSNIQPNCEYLYQKKEEEIRKLQKEIEREKESKLKEILLKKSKLDTNQIRQHEIKYQKRLEELKTDEKKSIKSSSVKSLANYPKNHYTKLVQEQLFEHKEKQYEKLMKLREHRSKQKMSNYQKHIDEHFKPKIDESKVITPVHRTYSTRSLSKDERIQRGLQYLEMAKQMKKDKINKTNIANQTQKLSQRFIYKDYLQDIKRKHSFDPSEKQFNELTNSGNAGKYDNLIRAKLLAEGLTAKSKKPKDEKAYLSFKNKLQILEGLYQ